LTEEIINKSFWLSFHHGGVGLDVVFDVSRE
jgi:hypothetical protein